MEQELVKDISLLYNEESKKIEYMDIVEIVRKYHDDEDLHQRVANVIGPHLNFKKDHSKETITSLTVDAIESYYQEQECEKELCAEFEKVIDNYFLKRNNTVNKYHKSIEENQSICGSRYGDFIEEYMIKKVKSLEEKE